MVRFSSVNLTNPYSFGLAVFRRIAKKVPTVEDFRGDRSSPGMSLDQLCTLFQSEAALMLEANPEWGDKSLDFWARAYKDADLTFEYIVRRQVAPTHRGVLLNFVKTTHPTPGEIVYDGEFTGRTEVWGFNESVTARVFDPIGEITARVFEAAAVKNFIVQRVLAGGIPRYVKTDQPIEGELVFFGQFLERSVTRGSNESVRTDICEPIGDVISQRYSAEKSSEK
jgi:hypothetical protein